ncbi:MAG: glycosyltransferase family 4 protein, partial [Chloroflexi bacterium]
MRQVVRILHVATRLAPGGAPRNIAFTLEWELNHGHEVHLALGSKQLPSGFPAGIHLHVVPDLVRGLNVVRDLRANRDLGVLIRRLQVDVVHTHYSKAGILGRIAARGQTPVLVHTVHMASFGSGYPRALSLLFRAAE